MPYIIGVLTNIEKKILEDRGLKVEPPSPNAIVGTGNRYQVQVDGAMFPIVAAYMSRNSLIEPEQDKVDELNARDAEIQQALRNLRLRLALAINRCEHEETNIAQSHAEHWDQEFLHQHQNRLDAAIAVRDNVESEFATKRRELDELFRFRREPPMPRWNTGTFKVLNTSLNPEDVDPRYIIVMQDVHIEKTGKFEIVDKKVSIDPATGDTMVALEYIEREELTGPQPDDDLM